MSAVNNFDDTAALLLGDGAGALVAAPMLRATDSFPLATDFDDIDGDAELDWITSSYAGDWRLYANHGSGASASCAALRCRRRHRAP